MNIILCASRDVNDKAIVENIFFNYVLRVQYESVISLKDIRFILVDDGAGSNHLKAACRKYGITPEVHVPRWNDLTEYPQLIKEGSQGKYNLFAPKNRNRRVLDSCGIDDTFALCVYKTKKDISDFLSKAKQYPNVFIQLEKIKE